MAKKSIGDINGWIFIGVGFIVVAVSIFFYDTLKIFIALGGLMTLYGLGKLSYDNLKAKIFPKEEEESPVDLNKAQNPYLQQKTAQHTQRPQQATQIQHHQVAHPTHTQQRVQPPRQMQTQHQQSQQTQYAHQQRVQMQQRTAHPQHNQNLGKYCHGCGTAKQAHHRFCAHCGTRFA